MDILAEMPKFPEREVYIGFSWVINLKLLMAIVIDFDNLFEVLVD